jgi:hypothetical protein
LVFETFGLRWTSKAEGTEGTVGKSMDVLLWLMIPVAFLIAGTIWASIRSRPPRPAAMQDSMASFSRFRHALAASTASSPPRHLIHAADIHAPNAAAAVEQGDLDEPAPSVRHPE